MMKNDNFTNNIDITQYICKYRDSIIQLWHNISSEKIKEYDWELCDIFADICERIFYIIVLRSDGIFNTSKSKQYDKNPKNIPIFIVVPTTTNIDIYIGESRNHSLIWTIQAYPEKDMILAFVDLYDFELYDPKRTFNYIMAQIIKASSPELCNHYVLIPINSARIFFSAME